MESLEKRYIALIKCLTALDESINLFRSERFLELHRQLRDSVIQRFEFTIDTFWKFIREYIETRGKVVFATASPGGVLKKAFMVGLINNEEYEIFEKMLKDRNVTSHTYGESLAEEISDRIQSYYCLLKDVVERNKPEDQV